MLVSTRELYWRRLFLNMCDLKGAAIVRVIGACGWPRPLKVLREHCAQHVIAQEVLYAAQPGDIVSRTRAAHDLYTFDKHCACKIATRLCSLNILLYVLLPYATLVVAALLRLFCLSFTHCSGGHLVPTSVAKETRHPS